MISRARATLEAQISARLAKAESDIAASKSKAFARVGDIATELAGAIVTRVIGRCHGEVERACNQRAPGETAG